MCLEKKEEEDTPAMKIESMHWYDNLKTAVKSKERLITMARITITRKQKWEEKLLYEYFKQQASKIPHEMIGTG